jgi:hypothetical protein
VLLAALAATKHASERVREAAYGLLRQLAAHQAGHFGPVLDVVMQPLLLGCADPSREVRATAPRPPPSAASRGGLAVLPPCTFCPHAALARLEI